MPEPLSESISKKVDMSTLVGRWKWMTWIVDHIDACCGKQQPPYTPEALQNHTPKSVLSSNDDKLDAIWCRWVDDTLEARRHNTMALRTCLRCYGIASESLKEAKPDKKHKPQELKDLLLAYLHEVWDLSDEEIEDAQGNVDTFAAEKVAILTAGYISNDWLRGPWR